MKHGGLFVVDVFTSNQYREFTDSLTVEYENGGFWRADPYINIKRNASYPNQNYLVQYTIITAEDCATYNIWNHGFEPQEIKKDLLPYTPTAEELENPESIVIWYIDGSGNVVTISSGRYDPTSGTVTFSTTHFSDYAVAYHPVCFNDVAADAWYFKAVGFLAAREITTGTDNGNYSPEAALTRGDFMVLLMRAYGISPDPDPEENFTDAGNTYYTGYLAAAKRLGIANGGGDNLFAPEKPITRQEMFTLLYNTLKTLNRLPEEISGKTLADFPDSGDVATWAKDAMTLLVEAGTISGSGGKLAPTDTTTRAEMAQALYNLLTFCFSCFTLFS